MVKGSDIILILVRRLQNGSVGSMILNDCWGIVGHDLVPACCGGDYERVQLRLVDQYRFALHYVKQAKNKHLILLHRLGYIPGHIHAFYLIWRRMEAEEKYGAGGFNYVGNGHYEPAYVTTGQPPAQPANYG
ncbi:hypothetical protein FRC09_012526, partial [Ceratobasidium sp. 395]